MSYRLRIPIRGIGLPKLRLVKREAYDRLPNINLLPVEFVRRFLTRTGLLLAVFVLAEVGFIFLFQGQAASRAQTMASSRTQVATLTRNLQEAIRNQDEATRLRSQMVVLTEMPGAYIQLVSPFDVSALQQKLLEKVPSGLEITDFRGRGTAVTIQGRARPEVALDYYQRLRGSPLFNSVTLKVVDYPETAPLGSFSIEITIKERAR